MTATHKPKVLAISSGGGHWVQLVRLSPAFADSVVTFVTVRPGYKSDVAPGARFRVIPDANRTHRLRLICSAIMVLWILLTERPDTVVTTGAAPGYFAIRFGRLLGIRTIWVDSIANAEELSLSGKQAGKYAHLWLTQWEHLAKPGGPCFKGNVL